MRITQKTIQEAFKKAEESFEFCWTVLVDLKQHKIKENEFGIRFISFQDKLAETIFDLHSIRDLIIKEEKKFLFKRVSFNKEWFVSKMRLLSGFKEGIDILVNIGKALGDAYAYFFYQNDLELLADHLSHQRVINNTAGNGERAELEFIRNIKHIQGEFTLFHGITNILRYGDFSFIDLKQLQVSQIGELKSRRTGDGTIEGNITLFKKKDNPKPGPIKNPEMEKDREGRQRLGIANFLIGENKNTNSLDSRLLNQSYADVVNKLLKEAKTNKINSEQASPGLIFNCVKFKPMPLYEHLFKRKSKEIVTKSAAIVQQSVTNLIKSGVNGNAIVISQLLYEKDFSDKSTPGTVPIFWHSIESDLLKQIYFGQSTVISMFNPVHLIHEIEKLGLTVESQYYKMDIPIPDSGKKGVIYRFDLFISYIVDHLLTEKFVIDTVLEIQKSKMWGTTVQITVKPQQHINILKNPGL